MKALRYISIILCVAFASQPVLFAQNESTASIVRRAKIDAQKDKDGKQVTQRMQNLFESKSADDAELEWMRIIYRSLDLVNVEQNAPLYYPEEPNADGQNMFFIIMRLLAKGQIPAYEYLDGKEIFSDQYKIKVKDMFERFHVLYTDAKGSTEKKPLYNLEDSDIPSNEVLSYYIIERWEFDRRKGEMQRHVDAICPVLHRSDDYGGEPIKFPMFWVKMDDLRPHISQQYVFTSNDNNLARHSYADYFTKSMYKGEIYKYKNLRNLSMMQMYPDPDDLKHAQDSIEKRLNSFDKNLWVPSREELRARAEAEEAAANPDTETIASRDGTEAPAPKASAAKRTTKRGSTKAAKPAKTKTSTKKAKSSAPKSTNSSAVRSVRSRK